MEFDIYADESGIEALKTKEVHKFMAIGGVWIPAESREDVKANIDALKLKHNINYEMKWSKVSPSLFNFYQDVFLYCFSDNLIRCRVLIIESQMVNNIKYNNADNELGFYKFYYQLIHHWILDFNSYNIFLDNKTNHDRHRLKTLRNVLSNANLTSIINNVQHVPSHESSLIQLADLITGVVASKFNHQHSSSAKSELIALIESKRCLGKPIAPTGKWEERLNIFKINLQGGW